MHLSYTKADGKTESQILKKEPLTIGRGRDADWAIIDEKASRIHCGIEWDGDFYCIRDLKSRNGTYVNGQRVDAAELHSGDQIRIGSTVISISEQAQPGAATVIREVSEEMQSGKGFRTIMREIVGEDDD